MALGKKGEITSNATLNNGVKDVKSFLLDPIVVTKDNIESTIIKDGFHSKDAIYK